MEQASNSFLVKDSVGKLMRKYCIPCVISLVVAAVPLSAWPWAAIERRMPTGALTMPLCCAWLPAWY